MLYIGPFFGGFASCEKVFTKKYERIYLEQSHENLRNALIVEYGTIFTYEPNLLHVSYGRKKQILCRASICFPLAGKYR
jgi:hypothetical protein